MRCIPVHLGLFWCHCSTDAKAIQEDGWGIYLKIFGFFKMCFEEVLPIIYPFCAVERFSRADNNIFLYAQAAVLGGAGSKLEFCLPSVQKGYLPRTQAVKFAQRLSHACNSGKGTNMNNAAAVVLGLLIGWLVEWVIDWFYWRGRTRSVASENLTLKERIASLEKELERKVKAVKAAPLRDRAGNDNLQAIHGIGPAFSKRLNEAGIHTFEHLSRLTPRKLEEILGTLFKRFFSKENTTLAQAKEFAQQKAKQG